MPYDEVPGLFAQMLRYPDTTGRDALLFAILTAARSGETRRAVWSEIDLASATWSIPAARMKMKRPHVVPLSASAVKILRRRWALRLTDSGFVFSTHGRAPISDMTMTNNLRDAGHQRITVRGFRNSFTDWAAELIKYRKEVVDNVLAQKLVDRVEAAYRRTDFFDRRGNLMADRAALLHDDPFRF